MTLDERSHAAARRLAGAPISWGVCEVPGWGRQLPPARVLAEMASLGLTATELGPIGYLPLDPAALRARLAEHGLGLVGGFVPLVLHEPSLDRARQRAEEVAATMAAAGADVFVAALVMDADWAAPAPLDDDGVRAPGRAPGRDRGARAGPRARRSRCIRTPARWSRRRRTWSGCSPPATWAGAWTPGTS